MINSPRTSLPTTSFSMYMARGAPIMGSRKRSLTDPAPSSVLCGFTTTFCSA
jgi:hypothetical protein